MIKFKQPISVSFMHLAIFSKSPKGNMPMMKRQSHPSPIWQPPLHTQSGPGPLRYTMIRHIISFVLPTTFITLGHTLIRLSLRPPHTFSDNQRKDENCCDFIQFKQKEWLLKKERQTIFLSLERGSNTFFSSVFSIPPPPPLCRNLV